ncbi:hypothetical protein V8Z80_19380 [Orrella sp. JC864]
MTEFLTKTFRAFALLVLALLGMGMALIFMFSTAIAVGVLYLVARLRGRPFGVRAYWQQRQAARPGPAGFGAASFGAAGARGHAGGFGAAPGQAQGGGFRPRRPAEITDVESRDLP